MPSVVLQECVALFCSGCGVKKYIFPSPFLPRSCLAVVRVGWGQEQAGLVPLGRAVPELQSQLRISPASAQPGTQLSAVGMLEMIKDSDGNCSLVAKNVFC